MHKNNTSIIRKEEEKGVNLQGIKRFSFHNNHFFFFFFHLAPSFFSPIFHYVLGFASLQHFWSIKKLNITVVQKKKAQSDCKLLQKKNDNNNDKNKTNPVHISFFLIRLSKLSKTCVLLFKKIVLHAFAL